MDSSRFDRLTRLFATRATRRATVAAGAGAVAMSLGAGPASASVARASTPVAAQDAAATPLFLYVQTFGGGTLAALEGQPDRYLLTLTDAPAMTVVFADHPSRETNLLPTERLPEVLAFTEANPPNAALVTRADDGDEVVLVIELLEPTYDAATRTVTYEVIELAEYAAIGDEILSRAQPLGSAPASFGLTQLFIDSGGDGSCRDSLEVCGSSDECCGGFVCAYISCTPDDPSVTSYGGSNLSMCVPPAP